MMRRFGTVSDVTSCCEAAYFQVHMFANALRITNTTDTDRLREALRGADFDAPQGRVKIDADNNHTYLQSRIGRVDERGEYIVEMEVTRPVKPDPYLVVPALNDWSLRLMPPREGLINY
jgi:branched-chain amino acid transport system substrate-binding protein